MNEDSIDEPYVNNTVVLRKNLMILLLAVLVILCLYMMTIQKSQDKIDCDNTLSQRCYSLNGIPIGEINNTNFTLIK